MVDSEKKPVRVSARRILKLFLFLGVLYVVCVIFMLVMARGQRKPNSIEITVINRRSQSEVIELVLQTPSGKVILDPIKGNVPAAYSERFTIAKPAGSSAPMKLVLRTKKGDAVTILLDSSESSVARTIELTRDRKAVVSQN